jgi:[acyl-carrier-protein] S-malonyltransferase
MKIAMIFPGYGSQFVGMGKELYDEFRIMQEYFEEAASCLDTNFVKLCFASSDVELGKMAHAYTSIFLVSSSIFRILKDEGIDPEIVSGLDIGEFSAIYAAGGISFTDGIYLINKYVKFYEEFLTSIDVSLIKVSDIKSDTVKEICEQYSVNETFASIAIQITENLCIVAGHASVVEQVSEALKQHKAKIESAGVEFGLHSGIMRPVFDFLKLYLEKVDFHDAEIPFLSSTEIHTIRKGQSIRAAVLEHITSPLYWDKVMDYLHDYDVLIEIGPGTMLRDIAQMLYPEKIVMSVNNKADINKLKEIVEAQKDQEKEEKEISEDK